MKEESVKTKKNRSARPEHWVVVAWLLVLYDAIAISASYFFALWLRFDCQYSRIPRELFLNWAKFTPIYIVVSVAVFAYFRLYRSIWRFASYSELLRTFAACYVTAMLHVIGISLIFGNMPVSYYIVGGIVQFCLVISVRFIYRFILLLRKKQTIFVCIRVIRVRKNITQVTQIWVNLRVEICKLSNICDRPNQGHR